MTQPESSTKDANASRQLSATRSVESCSPVPVWELPHTLSVGKSYTSSSSGCPSPSSSSASLDCYAEMVRQTDKFAQQHAPFRANKENGKKAKNDEVMEHIGTFSLEDIDMSRIEQNGVGRQKAKVNCLVKFMATYSCFCVVKNGPGNQQIQIWNTTVREDYHPTLLMTEETC